MSAPADIILHRLSEIGATVNASGDRLIVRAGTKRVPAELVKGVRAVRAELLAVLNPPPAPSDTTLLEVEEAGDAAWWRREFRVRTMHRLGVGRTYNEAEGLAWRDLRYHWHKRHGRQFPRSQCAGCGAALVDAAPFDLGDGNCVHYTPLDCLIRYGARWRGDATRALVAMGLMPPDSEDS
jgi:hypothetical protein